MKQKKDKKTKKLNISQQRARYCYVGLSVWIFLLIAATYKYLGSHDNSSGNYKEPNLIPQQASQHAAYDFMQTYNRGTRRIFAVCNDPENISYGTEGLLSSPQWQLQQVITLIRHGDRGPLAHIREGDSINCALDPNYYSMLLLKQYKDYVHELLSSGRSPWGQGGPFHGFPLIQSTQHCELGQLTEIGLSQLLNIGKILHDAYSQKLQMDNATADDVLIYSTKLHRTFQSGLAFLFGFLPTDLFSKVHIKDSDSVTFCFNDCACPAAEHYTKMVLSESEERLKSHPAVLELVEESAHIIYKVPEKSLFKNPIFLRDSLLIFICHDAKLPCITVPSESEPEEKCIKPDQVARLLTYHDWEQEQQTKNSYLKHARMLRAYGLLRNIVNQMLKHISDQKPKFILFSGHDWTLQFLTTALGLQETADITQYASRLVFEMYKNTSREESGDGKNYMFRFLANGRDITKELPFCTGNNLLKLGYFIYGCRIEAIVRYIHDDYFTSFNSTNFKDACHL